MPIQFPETTAHYLTDWWLEIGPSEGEGPISWQALESWQRQMGTELEPWEGLAIRAMSKAYLNSKWEGRKPTCPAPYSFETAEEAEDRVTSQFAAMFKALQARGK